MSTSASTKFFLYSKSGRIVLQYMTCGNITIVKNLDVTLDDLVDLYRWVLMNDWIQVRSLSED